MSKINNNVDCKELVLFPKDAAHNVLFASGYGMAFSKTKTKFAIFDNAVTAVGGAAVAGISSYLLEAHKDLPKKEKIALTVVAALGGAAFAGGVVGAIQNAKALKEIEKVNNDLEASLDRLIDGDDTEEIKQKLEKYLASSNE